jgi:WD40 repeat protein
MTIDPYRIFTGHKAMIFALSDIPGTSSFLSGSADGALVVWDIATGDGRLLARLDEPILTIVPDSSDVSIIWVGTLEGHLHKINIHSGEFRKIKLIKGGILSIVLQDKNIFISGDEGLIIALDKETLKIETSIVVSHKRCRALIPQDDKLIAGTNEGRLIQLSPQNLNIIKQSEYVHNKPLLHLCLLQDIIYATSLDGKILLYDHELHLIKDIAAHSSAVYDICPIAGDTMLASASRDKTIRLWQPDSMHLLKTIDRFYHEGHYRSVNALLWLAPENLLISGGDDMSIRAWKFIN